jgi:pyruvate dehydrogenase E1 component alpha subunit
MAKKAENKTKYSKRNLYVLVRVDGLQRKFEEQTGQLYGQQKSKALHFVHIGQACSSGEQIFEEVINTLLPTVITEFPLALGSDPNTVMAELLWEETTGISRERWFNAHL